MSENAPWREIKAEHRPRTSHIRLSVGSLGALMVCVGQALLVFRIPTPPALVIFLLLVLGSVLICWDGDL